MEKFFSYIKGHPLKSLFFLFLALYPLAFLLMMWIGGVDDPGKAFFLTLPAAFGDIELNILEEKGGKVGVIAIFCLILNVCLLGIIFAGLTNYLCDLSSKGGPIRRRVKYNGHIVICGWNYQGNVIIDALQSKDIHRKKVIAVLADREKRPFERRGVDFLSGSPLREEDLKRAGVDRADSVIILTDILGEELRNSDSDALQITTLIRKCIKSGAHISVQLLSSQNEKLLDAAGANTIVCLDQLGGSILAFSAEYHGIFKIIHELLFTFEGSEIYRFNKEKIPDKYIGKNFREVGKQLLDKKMILVAIETEDDDYVRKVCSKDYIQYFTEPKSGEKKALIVNPQGDYELKGGESLFIISEEEPTKL